MSTISNDNVGVGATTAAANANSKFSDVATATATGAVNEDNLRTEAVDRRNISTNPSLVKTAYVDNQNGTTIGSLLYTGKTGANDYQVDHDGTTASSDGLEIDWSGAPIPLVANDLLRIHFTIHFKQVDPAGSTGWGTFNPTVGDQMCLVAFPIWDIGSSYESMPGNADFTTTLSSGDVISFEETGSTWRTKGFAVYGIDGRDSGSLEVYERTMHGCFNYVHTGATVSIRKIRVNARGFLAYGADASGRFLGWTAGTNAYGSDTGHDWGRGQLAAMILRGDT